MSRIAIGRSIRFAALFRPESIQGKPMGLPANCDSEKIAEIAIGLMRLTLHGPSMGLRAWKSLDWDVLELLFEKGWIGDPKSKARSVIVTEEGDTQARLMFEKHFGQQPS